MTATLYPLPRRVERLPGSSEPPPQVELSIDGPERERERLLQRARELFPGIEFRPGSGDRAWILATRSGKLPPEAYAFTWNAGQLHIEAGGAAGLAYGLTTFRQWSSSGPPLGHVRIRDEPSLRRRGVLLDISRDKVPTMETLYGLVDLLASWKINELQLYTEHTFAYVGHETVWRDASPMTPAEIRALDRYCADRYVELVPNQNSLGHFHRWLVHEPYRTLAECPEGVEHPFSPVVEPFSLCPTDPRALELLEDLYDQLLPHFTSRRLNVGMDESFDIGRGRSAAAVEAKGVGRVYLDFVRAVHALAAARDHTIELWGDIILEHPELVPEIPSDATVLQWGYEADHPFAEESARFAEADRSFVLCPGTSSWNSLVGRTSNALENIASAGRQAHRHGAEGLLVTDWGDFGHWQPLAASYVGLAAGAGAAWRAETAPDGSAVRDAVSASIAPNDRHAEIARTLVDLGDVHHETGATPKNGTAPFFALLFPATELDHARLRGATPEGCRRAAERYSEHATAVDVVSGEEARDPNVHREIAWAARLASLGADLLAERIERSEAVSRLPGATRSSFRARLADLVAERAAIWAARNRPGGFADSNRRMDDLFAALEG